MDERLIDIKWKKEESGVLSPEEIEEFGVGADSNPPMAKGIPIKGDENVTTYNSSSPKEKEKTQTAPDTIKGKSNENR